MIDWRYRHSVLVLCTLGFGATMVARVVISPIVPDLTADFSVSTGLIGFALSGMWAAYALAQFPSGVLADRYGERPVILAGVGGTAAASLLLAISPAYGTFALFAIVLGAVAGLVYSAATSLVTKQADATGRAIGLYITGGPIAGLLAPPVAAAVGAQFGWRYALALGALAALPVVALFAWRVEPTPGGEVEPIEEQVDPGQLFALLSRPRIAQTTLLAILGAFVWQATASFMPAFLEAYRGFSLPTASLIFSGFFLVHGLTQPITGSLSDRYSRTGAAALTFGVGVVGFGLFVVGSTLSSALVAAALVGLAMSWGAPLQSRFMDALGDAERGTGFGLVRTVYMLCGSAGSLVAGVVADVAGWAMAFGLLAGLMAVGMAVLLATGVAGQVRERWVARG